MKKITLILFAMLIGIGAIAQKSKVRTAYFNYTSGNISDAIENIEIGVKDAKAAADPKSWYYRGLIYEKAYELGEEETGVSKRESLERAYNSYMKVFEVDEKDKYTEDVLRPGLPTGMNFIRISYANEGDILRAEEDNYKTAYEYYVRSNEASEMLQDKFGQDIIGVDTSVIFLKGWSAEQSGMDAEAEEAYERLLELGYDQPMFFKTYSSYLMNQERYEEAITVLSKGQELDPDNIDLIIEELNIYLVTDQTDKAVNRFERAIELDPENAQLHFALGTIYDKLLAHAQSTGADESDIERFENKMITSYKNAIEHDPEHFKAVYNLGVVYFNRAVEISKEMNELPLSAKEEYKEYEKLRNEHLTEARPYLETAYSLDNKDISTIKALKEVYMRLNMTEEYNEMSRAEQAAGAE